MAVFVGSKEIREKKVSGTYRKYTYISHSNRCPQGVPCHVYCTSDHDFIRLLTHWDEQVTSPRYQELGYRYTLSLKGYHGEDIPLRDIPADNKFKVKVLLTCPYTGVTYIQ